MAENYRKTVFCEVQFLKECLSQVDIVEYDCASLQKLRFWKSIENLLLSPNIKLFLDISSDVFDSEIKSIEKQKQKAAKKNENTQLEGYGELLWRLNCLQIESNIHLKCLGEDYVPIDSYENIKNLNINAIYLTCKDADMCEKISCTYGISVLTSKKMDVNKQLFEDVGCAIYKGEKNANWIKILQGKCKTCNALIIVDNYILSDIMYIDENLRDILQSVLPDTLAKNVTFHLSIFTSDLKNRSKDRLDKLKNIVRELRPELCCEISIFKNSADAFHDRTIITNSLWIGCGGGFDLFKKGMATKMTVVSIVNPYLTDTMQWAKKAYSNLVKTIGNIINNRNEYINDSYPTFYLGAGINRLIE